MEVWKFIVICIVIPAVISHIVTKNEFQKLSEEINQQGKNR